MTPGWEPQQQGSVFPSSLSRVHLLGTRRSPILQVKLNWILLHSWWWTRWLKWQRLQRHVIKLSACFASRASSSSLFRGASSLVTMKYILKSSAGISSPSWRFENTLARGRPRELRLAATQIQCQCQKIENIGLVGRLAGNILHKKAQRDLCRRASVNQRYLNHISTSKAVSSPCLIIVKIPQRINPFPTSESSFTVTS